MRLSVLGRSPLVTDPRNRNGDDNHKDGSNTVFTVVAVVVVIVRVRVVRRPADKS